MNLFYKLRKKYFLRHIHKRNLLTPFRKPDTQEMLEAIPVAEGNNIGQEHGYILRKEECQRRNM